MNTIRYFIIPWLVLFLACLIHHPGYSQGFLQNSQLHGNFEATGMYYMKDAAIGADSVTEKMRFNGYMNVVYSNGPFSAGIRFESYLNALLGFNQNYKGTGWPYKYASFTKDNFEITAGDFYEQFGSGLIFRSYEDKNLGYDNAMQGVRVKYSPVNGINLKGIYGYQRYYFSHGEGIVRGFDADFSVNDIFKKLNDKKTRWTIGGSIISKYQKDDSPIYILPENVASFAGRGSVTSGGFSLGAEYVYKINDPSFDNHMIYKPGEALLIQASWSQKGIGIYLAAKRIDNMSFRSDRNKTINDLLVNFLPPLTKQHVYMLPSMYPYATQPNGEMGVEGQITYSFKKKTKLGGKYGTTININYSRANAIDKQKIDENTPIDSTGTLGYKSNFFKFGKETYFEDANLEIVHKFSKFFKLGITYAYLTYNHVVVEGHGEGMVYAHAGIADMTFNLNEKHSLRTELQYLHTKEDDHDWVMGLIEYTVAPTWFVTVLDSWNYGNPDSGKKVHYYNLMAGFNYGSSRLALSYGRQREGLLCAGGVCRTVPAASGFTLTLTSSF